MRALCALGPRWTAEQLTAIERRGGDLLLAAGAGSGKTSVLVERFARAVLEDGVDVAAILTITFTDKAAAELRARIRSRLRELGAEEAARATEGAWISTIHGFCARVLRAHALAAGIDPAFSVLDQSDAERLADAAFEEALEDLGQNAAGGVELIASYGPGPLRGAALGVSAELRSRGEPRPALPPLPAAPDLDQARAELSLAATRAVDELRDIAEPAACVVQALERLERCAELIAADPDPWPGELDQLTLPGGNGAALTTPACAAYDQALTLVRRACEHHRAQRAHELLNGLLIGFGARYAERKRDCSALDFEDLELMTRELLLADELLRERLKTRFAHIMIDELQDTNRVQLELIELIAGQNLFTVGDAQQSIYGFRHADVELFERRGERLAQVGGRATLQTNFRSRPEILDAIDAAFTSELGERFTPLRAGRTEGPAATEPLVELLIVDKDAEWEQEGLAAPWRVAEARALAARIRELLDGGASPREIVVLTRATTDLRTYERALEDRGIPTYVIGGRGYWSHPQVVDLVAYLRALANPRDDEALYTVLVSPLVGVSVDALVVLADAARSAACDPWWILREPEGRLEDIPGREDRDKLAAFAAWFAAEREVAVRAGVDELVQRVLERTGYDLAILAMNGGQRRLANVRKLMRLGREHEAAHGRDLRGFLNLVRGRAEGWSGSRDARESEAPVEGEALDAVRLLTIHRAKGLEFEIVCVADLGRAPRRGGELLRVGRDGRFGLRLAEPGTGKRASALDYKALGEEQARRADEEERRLFYVAMTRARERLILSGAAKLDGLGSGGGGTPMAWIAKAFVPDLAARVSERSGTTDGGVRWAVVSGAHEIWSEYGPKTHANLVSTAVATPAEPLATAAAERASAVANLSYSSLAEYRRCGYRFYAQRVLGLPEVRDRGGTSSPRSDEAPAGAERGILVHALLERLDFRRPVRPSAEAILAAARRAGLGAAPPVDEIAGYLEAFAASALCARLGRATHVRREERFSFLLDAPAGAAAGPARADVLITGALDVLAREPGGGMLVVDYKSDRLEGAAPDDVVARDYATQRTIYALAVLRRGAARLEVVHAFLEAPDRPVVAAFTQADAPALERELAALARGPLGRRFAVSEAPHRALCGGCPAEGGLCSWPLALTRREAPDRLF